MLRLREIMSTDVVTVTPETTIREAMEVLAKRHMSGAPVVSGEELVGIVTANDLMAFTAAIPGVPTERETRDEWIEWAQPSVADEVEAEAEPSGAYFSDLWEDAGADVAERFADIASPEWNALEEHDVSEVMTHAPLSTLSPDDEAETAADLMRRNAIHRVLVTEGDRLVGVVSSLDIARAAADHKFHTRTYVFNPDPEFDEQ
jgi:CBS domain-containing protein